MRFPSPALSTRAHVLTVWLEKFNGSVSNAYFFLLCTRVTQQEGTYITKQLEARTLSTQDTRSNGTRIQTDTQAQVLSARSKLIFQLLDQDDEFFNTVTSKASYDDGVLLSRIGKTRDSDIAISDSLNLYSRK